MPKPHTLLNQWLKAAVDNNEMTESEITDVNNHAEVFYHIAETKEINFKNTMWNEDFFLVEFEELFENWLLWLSDKKVSAEITIESPF